MHEPETAAQYLAAIVESSDDAIVSKDLNSIIKTWNKGAERIFGYTDVEVIGRSIRLIIPADLQSEEDEVLRRIRNGEIVDHFETTRVRKDGTRVPVSLTVSPIHDATGRIVGASKIARDISERRRVEAALANAEAERVDLQARLLKLVAASGSLLGSPRVATVLQATVSLASELVAADGYAMWRLHGDRWTIDSHAGLSADFAEQVIASEPGSAAPPLPLLEPLVVEDVDTVLALEHRRAAHRREGIRSLLAVPLIVRGRATATLSIYFRLPHAFSEVEIQTARALGNLLSGALTVAELYDDQRRGEQRALFLARAGEVLVSSLDYLDTLRTVATLAVPHIADWCAIHLQPPTDELQLVALANADPAKVDAARAYCAAHPHPAAESSVARVIQTGQAMLLESVPDDRLVEIVGRQPDLAVLRALGIESFLCVPLQTREGVIGAITFVSSQDARRFTASDLRFAESVAGRVALAIENARAFDQARQANRLKDEFLATLSHELRTPLNAIVGYTHMLRTGAIAADKQVPALDTIERNASSLTQIVEDVLDISRIVTGRMRLNVGEIELTPVVGNAIGTVLPAAQAKGVRVEAALPADATMVYGDADRLHQVFWNLLTNAVKFTPRGGTILIRSERVGAEIEISVTDTGEGISPEFLPYVFDRFRQMDSRLSRGHGGLGLGLAIVRHIIEMHGGRIQAASDGQGRGATFRVVLPAAVTVPATTG